MLFEFSPSSLRQSSYKSSNSRKYRLSLRTLLFLKQKLKWCKWSSAAKSTCKVSWRVKKVTSLGNSFKTLWKMCSGLWIIQLMSWDAKKLWYRIWSRHLSRKRMWLRVPGADWTNAVKQLRGSLWRPRLKRCGMWRTWNSLMRSYWNRGVMSWPPRDAIWIRKF